MQFNHKQALRDLLTMYIHETGGEFTLPYVFEAEYVEWDCKANTEDFDPTDIKAYRVMDKIYMELTSNAPVVDTIEYIFRELNINGTSDLMELYYDELARNGAF